MTDKDNPSAFQEPLLSALRACRDCGHYVEGSKPLLCQAPQLSQVLDTLVHTNEVTLCSSAREFKFACGHAARWFTPKVKMP